MLISDSRKFIFIAIPKTGTHSVRNVLRDYSTDEHVGTGGGVSTPHQSRFKEFKSISHGHLTIRQLSSVVNLKPYFTFCVFRNPYSRAVSLWAFCTRNMNVKPNILTFFKSNHRMFNGILFKPQSYFITDEDGKVCIDYVIRFEDYQNGLNHVLKHLNIQPAQLPKINQSTHDYYQKYYDEHPKLKEIIKTRYAKDIEIYNGLLVGPSIR